MNPADIEIIRAYERSKSVAPDRPVYKLDSVGRVVTDTEAEHFLPLTSERVKLDDEEEEVSDD